MYNLANVHNLLAKVYVEKVNEFIGGEPAIKYDGQYLSSQNGEFFARLCSRIDKISAQDKRFEELQQKLDDAKQTLTSALQWLACPDDISELTGKCKEQNAFDEIRECLERIK